MSKLLRRTLPPKVTTCFEPARTVSPASMSYVCVEKLSWSGLAVAGSTSSRFGASALVMFVNAFTLMPRFR